jgi:ElaB/YqjD/DUF883 family membrane-anchored ribosome-binding protein
MLPKHRQLCAPCPNASATTFQALVDPPHDGNNLSFDRGDERTDGSDNNTIVNVYPCDCELPASPQDPQVLLPALDNINDRLEDLLNLGRAIRYTTDRMEAVLQDASDNNDDCFEVLNSKLDSFLQKMDVAWTETTALHEAYHASREKTALLKAAIITLTKKLNENIAISTLSSLETAPTSTAMEEMTMQLSHIHNDIHDVLEAVRNPLGKRKQCPRGLSWPDIPKSMIYNIIIECHAKLWFTVGSNVVAPSLITHLRD